MTKDAVLTLLANVLTFIGGVLINVEFLTASDGETFIGAGVALAGAVWNTVVNYKARQAGPAAAPTS